MAVCGGSAVPVPAASAVPSFAVRNSVHSRPAHKTAPAKSATSFDMHGTIVKVNHESKFAFIRTASRHTDFFVGRRHFRQGMKVGDEVSFEGEIEPRVQGGRCPEAYRVNFLARAWIRYRRPHGAPRSTGPKS